MIGFCRYIYIGVYHNIIILTATSFANMIKFLCTKIDLDL